MFLNKIGIQRNREFLLPSNLRSILYKNTIDSMIVKCKILISGATELAQTYIYLKKSEFRTKKRQCELTWFFLKIAISVPYYKCSSVNSQFVHYPMGIEHKLNVYKTYKRHNICDYGHM